MFIKSFRVGSTGLGLILILIEGFYGRSWLVCLVGGICLTLEETSTPPALLVKDWVFVHFSLAMMEFSNFILSMASSTSLVRGTFTWSNNRDPSSWSRIDRFLVSQEWGS